MQLKLIVILFFSLILVVFTIQNVTPVQIKFFGWQSAPLSLMVVVLISCLFGGIFATILGLLRQWKLMSIIKEKSREIETLAKLNATEKPKEEDSE